MAQNCFQVGDQMFSVVKPNIEDGTHLSEVSSESKLSKHSNGEEDYVEKSTVTDPLLINMPIPDPNTLATQKCISGQRFKEKFKNPLFTPRILKPFLSPSMLPSPSYSDEAEREANDHSSGFFSNVTQPQTSVPLSAVPSEETWTGSETSTADQLWDNMERKLKVELKEDIEEKGSMTYINNRENLVSKTCSTENSQRNVITNDKATRQNPAKYADTLETASEKGGLPLLEVRPELLCSFESLPNFDSPIEKVKGESGYLSTYIEKRDSLLKGLVADGGTRDFALWFDRLGPGLHCNQDFETETGTFGRDFWHDPFARSKSFDKYLGLLDGNSV